jgi:Septum formation
MEIRSTESAWEDRVFWIMRLRRRGLPTGVAVVLVIAARVAFQTWLDSPVETRPNTGGPDFSQITAPGDSADSGALLNDLVYHPGDCVDWDPDDPVLHNEIVGCSEPHRFEVTGELDIGYLTSYPTEAEFESLGAQGCGDISDGYLGHSIDPYGRFAISWVFPFAEDWARGGRYLTCGLVPFENSADAGVVTGRVAELDPSPHLAVGTCLAVAIQELDIVECSEPHLYEVAGQSEVLGRAEYPTDDEWAMISAELCAPVVAEYTGKPVTASPGEIDAVVLYTPELAWSAGGRGFDCVVLQLGMDGSEVEVTGSLGGEPRL